MLAIASRAIATVNSYMSPVKTMPAEESMDLFEARLKTFQGPRSTGRKRASNAKNGKAAKWALKSPSAEQLAQAGFYFAPTGTGSDNVTCFCCEKSLDGWEEGDDAFSEHLHFSNDCAWAILMAIENGSNEELQNADPMSEQMLEARRQTFRDQWPHERKRGWTCKIQKMIEGGWYFCPSPEGDDQANCVYCKKSLWGWEPKDKPYEEHKKRSPDCVFFQMAQAKPTTKARKARASKASRLSSQSNATIGVGESLTVDLDDDATQTSTMTADMSTASTTSKAKKSTKGKKKTTAKSTRSKVSAVPAEISEPSVETAPTRNTRSKKRTSEQMLEGSLVTAEPPQKRATRARAGTQTGTSEAPSAIVDVTIDDTELSAVKSRKGAKGSRKRASSTTRKASARVSSARSTTARAPSPVAIPADDDIDAELAADLERFDSDDDSDNWKVWDQDDSVASQIRLPQSTRTSNIRTQTAKTRSTADPEFLKEFSTDVLAQNVATPMLLQQPLDQYDVDLDLKRFEESLEADDQEQFASALDIKESSAVDKDSKSVSQATVGPRDSTTQQFKESWPVDDQAQEDNKTSKNGGKRKPPVKKAPTKGKNTKKRSIEIAFEAHEEVNDDDIAAELEAMQAEVQAQPSAPKQTADASVPAVDTVSDPIENHIPQGSRPIRGQFASPEASPQGSDAENQPPSSRPSQTRPPLAGYTPTGTRTVRIPLGPSTPTASPSKQNVGLQTTYPWTSANIDYILNGTMVADRENVDLKNLLSSDEKNMTLEEWIKWNAKKNEDRLKADCEMMVGKFESEGVRALKTLEGIVCLD